MKISEYTVFLRERDTPDIDDRITIIEDLITFLSGIGITDIAEAGKEQIGAYAKTLIDEGRNTEENFTYLWEYLRFS